MKPVSRFLVLGALTALCVAQGVAQPSVYAERRNAVNCGILLIPSTQTARYPGGTNADPYTFYNLLKRQDLLPGGWDLVNPFAPTTVTQTIFDRWKAVMNGTAPYTLGEKIQRSMAPYWEVYLDDLTDKQLAYYDVLMIHAPGYIGLSADQRERLRRFVDGGGILWLDKATNQTMDAFSGMPLQFTVTSGGTNPQVFDPLSPLLTYPHRLSYTEAAYLGVHRGAHAVVTTSLDFARFNMVVGNSAGGTIMDAAIGAGHFVVTAGNIVSNINEPAGGTAPGLGRNSGPYAGTNFLNIPTAEMKFAYNLMALSGGFTTANKSARKSNSTFEDLQAPLLEKYKMPNTPQRFDDDDGRFNKTPILFKGLIIITDGSTVYAYDADPRKDMDGDGNPDDGAPDLITGLEYDLVWKYATDSSTLSTALGVEVTNPSNVPKNQIWVLGDTGKTYVLNAFPLKTRNQLNSVQGATDVKIIDPPGTAWGMGGTILPPNQTLPNGLTYSDGMVFAAAGWQPNAGQPGGLCWVMSPKGANMVSLSKNTEPFVASGAGNAAYVRPFNTTATVAYVPQTDNGGASDQIVYAAFDHTSGTNVGAPGFAALWFRTKGEKLTFEGYDANNKISRFRCRAGTQNLSVYDGGANPEFADLNPRYYVYDGAGNPRADLASKISTGLGVGDFLADGNFTGFTVYADYTINWAKRQPLQGNIQQIARTVLEFPEDATPTGQVIKAMAVAPNGNLFVVVSDHEFTSNPKSGGAALYCFRERFGGTTLLYRWAVHGGYNHNLGGTSVVAVPPVLADNDDLVKVLIPFLDKPLGFLHFHGTPVIRNNVCYQVMSARKRIGFFDLPVTFIMAFDADPQPAEIRLGGPITGVVSEVEISQPDPAVSINKDNPTVMYRISNTAGTNNLEVDAPAGIIRVNNFMTNTKGRLQNAISVSQPVAVRISGQPAFLIDPNTTGSHWSPLKWYMSWNGFANESSVMVTGNTIFMAGSWAIESFVCSNGGPQQQIPIPKPVVVAMDADIPTNDQFLRNDPLVPNNTSSNRQLLYLLMNGTQMNWNDHVKWPSGEGTTTLSEFCTRVRQIALDDGSRRLNQRALGVMAGDGILLAWTQSKTFVFEKALTLLADQGRVLEVDSAGFPGWSSENSYAGAFNNGNLYLKVAKFANPTKAYRLSSAEYLVVDTAANRVVRVDRAGFEMRAIESFQVDGTMMKNGKLIGYNIGDPVTLKQPEDAQTWSDYIPAADNPFSNKQPLEYWVHYLVCDTGNGRMLEIVDRYFADATTFAVGNIIPTYGSAALAYHSPLNSLGKRFRYHSGSRVLTSLDMTTLAATYAFVSAVGNWETTGVAVGVEEFLGNDLQAYSGNGAVLVESFDKAKSFKDRLSVVTRVVMKNGQERPLINPSTAQVRQYSSNADGSLNLSVLVADQQGIVEFLLVKDKNGKWAGTEVWQLTNEDYLALRGVPLQALSARKLLNGNVLITNGYTGLDALGRDFTGEVVEIRGSDYNPTAVNHGFSITKGSVRMTIPPLVNARPLRLPTFADR